jgi:tetratricopeptide (TPR) repeat protein
MEIEYGYALRGRDPAERIPMSDWADRFMTAARDRLPRHLPSMEGAGIFLENGARFYVDCSHPEMTTPECANPWDVVRYMQAGERLLTAIADEMKRRESALAEVLLFKTNVDHSGSGATWGCHTSFMHRGNPELFPDQIIPHLVSRIIYSGAGGLELVDGRLRFTLSPRVRFLEREISNNSTRERGIFHTKDETLAADGYHRLHIICGESLCSETPLWLNMGATALIVAMIEAGLHPGDAVRLHNPLGAMRRFSVDPTCRAVAQTTSERKLSAVQIQRHYLAVAEAHRRAPFMPPWTDQVCSQWRLMLDRLENGAPGSVASMLDWAMKFCLFVDRAERRGLGPELWHHTHPATQNDLDDDEFPPPKEAGGPKPRTPTAPGVLKIHQELCEIDTRFGQIGGNGLFDTLDRAGVLKHHFDGVDNIEHAMVNPPAIGRARLRSQCVLRFAGQNRRYSCSWRYVVDHEKELLLDISDPFISREKWQAVPEGFRGSGNPVQDQLRPILGHARICHDRGNHESAAQHLRELEGFQNMLDSELHSEYLRLRAWVQSRRGFLDGILALDEMAQSQALTFRLVNDYVCAYRYQGLIPPRGIEAWIKRGYNFLTSEGASSDGPALPFLDHWGYFLLRNGRADEARCKLQDACQSVRRENTNPGAEARALADLGDALRALGHRAEASALLDEAQHLQVEHQLEGDHADFSLTYRAKLDPNPAIALGLLDQAKTIQTRLGNVMGEARTLLLEARLMSNPTVVARCKARLHELRGLRPALCKCRLFSKILDNWKDWISRAADPDGGIDSFWWL